jgi:hypothetical protein
MTLALYYAYMKLDTPEIAYRNGGNLGLKRIFVPSKMEKGP